MRSRHLGVELDRALWCQATLAHIDLGDSSIDTAESVSLVVRELVHSALGQVEACARVVDGEDVDGLAVVADRVTLAALGAVPAGDVAGATDEWEVGNGALGLVATESRQHTWSRIDRAYMTYYLVMRPFAPSEQDTAVMDRLPSS